MKIGKIIIASIVVIVVSASCLYGQEKEISKATAIDIAVKEAYERDYNNIWGIYVFKDETIWGKYPNSFRDKDFSEVNNKLAGRDFWDIYFRADSATLNDDIAICIDSTSGEIISIYGENVREKTRSYRPETKITMGDAAAIADAAAKANAYDISGKFYHITYNQPPWEKSESWRALFERKYPAE